MGYQLQYLLLSFGQLILSHEFSHGEAPKGNVYCRWATKFHVSVAHHDHHNGFLHRSSCRYGRLPLKDRATGRPETRSSPCKDVSSKIPGIGMLNAGTL